jgi:hypothetical protein
LPIGPGGGSVAAVLPGLDVTLQRRPVAHPVRQRCYGASGEDKALSPLESKLTGVPHAAAE